jgi:multisubunit Na+/H+ antiporter MnhE subunit
VLSRAKQGKHGSVARPNLQGLLPAALTWLALVGLWMVLSGDLVLSELVVGMVAAAISTIAFEVVRRRRLVRFRPRARWIWRAWRLPIRMFTEGWMVSWAALAGLIRRRPVRGRFREVPFPTGGTDPRSSARRTLVTLAVSLPANSYVVDLDTDNDTLLIHELVPQPGKEPIP